MTAPRIAMIVTRELEDSSMRYTIMRRAQAALAACAPVETLRLHNLLELRSLLELIAACLNWLPGLLRGKPMPLQCLLYNAPQQCKRLARQIAAGGFTHVYLDTVRCQGLLRVLRRRLPHLHIVTDFDDLMSRRMENLRQMGLPFLTGYAGRAFPPLLRLLAEGPLSRWIIRFEAWALHHAEEDVASASDAVVLISPEERAMLAARIPARAAHLHAVLPPIAQSRTAHHGPSLRFVFIGSDRQLQNRLPIDHLLALWRRLSPRAALHIYGRQARPLAFVAGVHWHGFAPDLAEVYSPGSILLYPGVLPGGIKTKIAEAWSYGVPVLGNGVAFEGYGLAHYPLNLPETAWDEFLLAPERYQLLFNRAATLGAEFVAQHLAPATFDAAWATAMALEPAGYGVSHDDAALVQTISAGGNNTPYCSVPRTAGLAQD